MKFGWVFQVALCLLKFSCLAQNTTRDYNLNSLGAFSTTLYLNSNNSYAFVLQINNSPNTGVVAKLSAGTYTESNDTLKLTDSDLGLKMRLLGSRKDKKIIPILCFPYLMNNTFQKNYYHDSTFTADSLINSFSKQNCGVTTGATKTIFASNIVGKYLDNDLQKDSDDNIVWGYWFQFTMNHYYFFYYDQVISHGKWSLKDGLVEMYDDNIEGHFKIAVNEDGSISPVKLINTYPSCKFYKQKQ